MASVGNGGRLSASVVLSTWRERLVRKARRLGSGPVLGLVTVGGAALLAESMHLIFHAS